MIANQAVLAEHGCQGKQAAILCKDTCTGFVFAHTHNGWWMVPLGAVWYD